MRELRSSTISFEPAGSRHVDRPFSPRSCYLLHFQEQRATPDLYPPLPGETCASVTATQHPSWPKGARRTMCNGTESCVAQAGNAYELVPLRIDLEKPSPRGAGTGCQCRILCRALSMAMCNGIPGPLAPWHGQGEPAFTSPTLLPLGVVFGKGAYITTCIHTYVLPAAE